MNFQKQEGTESVCKNYDRFKDKKKIFHFHYSFPVKFPLINKSLYKNYIVFPSKIPIIYFIDLSEFIT
ncbi:MAG TPA: hypothetical protein DCQ37_07475 [Desulfobacteraceae bacterium]|nr:hypothetical protein [Desulfobacteraceae bacterium]